MDRNDANDADEDEAVKADDLEEKISQLEEKKPQYEQAQNPMRMTGQKEVSLVDLNGRLMRVDSQRLEVGYNVQTSVDSKQLLIVDYGVINISTDRIGVGRSEYSY